MSQIFKTPLRYPGGKAKLSGFIKSVFADNSLMDGHYVEPYAGGAGIAFEVLFLECASHIHLNDIDRAVYCFWDAVVNHTDWLCKKITDTRISISQWKKQKAIHRDAANADPLELGFALFFLNRTNRSGILNGGVIGGLDQTGEWKIDARFNKPDLIQRIKKIASYRSRISIYNLDAAKFITEIISKLQQKALVYLDPPYFVKGKRLYRNHYKKNDHQVIAELIKSKISQRWIVSYDNVQDIIDLYAGHRRAVYNLDYSAAKRSVGSEVMFFCDNLVLNKPTLSGMKLVTPRKREFPILKNNDY